MKWQPIETAPLTEAEVVLWVETAIDSYAVNMAFYSRGHWRYWEGENRTLEDFERPTHWLKIVPPPWDCLERPPCSALALAKQFHDIYERLAPSFGYETRSETRDFDPDSVNGMLMIAVCKEIMESLMPNAVITGDSPVQGMVGETEVKSG